MKIAHDPSPRKLRPPATSTLALAPATVSDRTCALVLGLEPRVFREFVQREHIPHATIGRRLVCKVEDVIAALHLDGTEEDSERSDPPTPRENRVLRLLGRERA